MSQDDGVYIGQFNDGFRVVRMGAVDNLWYGTEQEQLEEQIKVFGNCKVYDNFPAALREATRLTESQQFYPEYGIVNLVFHYSLSEKMESKKQDIREVLLTKIKNHKERLTIYDNRRKDHYGTHAVKYAKATASYDETRFRIMELEELYKGVCEGKLIL